jgi:hypothetical protein
MLQCRGVVEVVELVEVGTVGRYGTVVVRHHPIAIVLEFL